MSTFVGFRLDGETRLVDVEHDGSPAALGLKVLAFCREITTPVVAGLVTSLRLVDPDDTPTPDYVAERFPTLWRLRHERTPGDGTWADWLPPFTSISDLLVHGVAADAETYGDQQWGYVLDLDDQSFDVYRRCLTPPTGKAARVILDGMYPIVGFYFRMLPDADDFLAAVDEELRAL